MKAKLEFFIGLVVVCAALYDWKTFPTKQFLIESIAIIFFFGLWIKENTERNE